MEIKEGWENQNTDKLFEAIALLQCGEESRKFLRDLMTVQEIETFAARLFAAQKLNEGTMSYREIADNTGMSTTTITRINNWLERGWGGYKLIIDRLKASTNSSLNHHHSTKDSVVL